MMKKATTKCIVSRIKKYNSTHVYVVSYRGIPIACSKGKRRASMIMSYAMGFTVPEKELADKRLLKEVALKVAQLDKEF